MKKYIYFLSIFFFLNIFHFSQAQDKVQSIRTLYQKVNESIAACKGEECSLFCNEVTVNSKNKSWRAVGIFKQSIQFWYTDQPEFYKESYPEEGEDGIGTLQKIVVETKSTYKENIEFLFDKGKLVFFYYKYAYNQEPTNKQEYRFYFSNDQLIKFVPTTTVKQEERMYQEKDWKLILEKAKEYQTLFIKTF